MIKQENRIHKRKDGRREGRYKTRKKKENTSYSCTHGKSYSEEKEKLRISKHIINNTLITTKRNVTFYFLAEQWLLANQCKFKKATLHKYSYLLEKHILPALGKKTIQSLSSIMINNFATEKLQQGSRRDGGPLSKAYVRSIMLVIGAIIKFSAKEGWCSRIDEDIYKPAPEKKELSILNKEEQTVLENYLILNPSCTATGILITLQTGLRIGEICALTWSDIDLKKRILYVRSTVSRIKNDKEKGTELIISTPKTNTSTRMIPITNKLYGFLETAQKAALSNFVVSENQNFVSPRTFTYRYHRIISKAGLKKINYHALRHSFATRCIEAGVDVKSLSEILGHSNVSITLNTYVHSSLERKRKMLEKLSESLLND